MGWSGGSDIACQIIRLAKEHVPAASKPKFYRGLICALESHDCDTLQEAEGIDAAYDKVLRKLYPSWYEVEADE